MADLTVTGGCQLQYASATQIKLVPMNGDNIQISGINYPIPSAGVTAANTGVYVNGTANQNLAASTLYYVYLFVNNGTLTIDFSSTGHVTDTVAGNVGIEIKSGDNSRSLIGMVYTNGSSQFSDSGANRLVASWFNRTQKTSRGNFTADHTVTATSLIEINSEIRASFLTWGTEDIVAHANVTTWTDSTATATINTFGLDSGFAQFGGALGGSVQMNCPINLNMSAPYSASEGYHFVTLLGNVSPSTTGTWYSSGASGIIYILSNI